MCDPRPCLCSWHYCGVSRGAGARTPPLGRRPCLWSSPAYSSGARASPPCAPAALHPTNHDNVFIRVGLRTDFVLPKLPEYPIPQYCPFVGRGHQVWRPPAGTPAFARVRSKCFSAAPSTRRSILGFDIFVGEGRAEGGVHVLSIVKTCRACMRHWQSCRTATDGLGIRILFAPPLPPGAYIQVLRHDFRRHQENRLHRTARRRLQRGL